MERRNMTALCCLGGSFSGRGAEEVQGGPGGRLGPPRHDSAQSRGHGAPLCPDAGAGL